MDSAKKSKKSKGEKGEKKSKKSGVRTKFLIESLRNEYYSLREENDRLRGIVKESLAPDISEQVLAECFDLNVSKGGAANIDELASKMEDTGVDDDEDDL
jgi:hypothetical protein